MNGILIILAYKIAYNYTSKQKMLKYNINPINIMLYIYIYILEKNSAMQGSIIY